MSATGQLETPSASVTTWPGLHCSVGLAGTEVILAALFLDQDSREQGTQYRNSRLTDAFTRH